MNRRSRSSILGRWRLYLFRRQPDLHPGVRVDRTGHHEPSHHRGQAVGLRGGGQGHVDGPTPIPSQLYEDDIIAALDSTLKFVESLGVGPPLSIMLTLVGVKGLSMALGQRWMAMSQPEIDRDLLLLPEVVFESYGLTGEDILKPFFEGGWQAAGFEKNLNYDEDGRRRHCGRLLSPDGGIDESPGLLRTWAR